MSSFAQTISPTFPDPEMTCSKAYQSSNFMVIDTSFIPDEECISEHYHFLIPISTASRTVMDNKQYLLKKESIFPCNPLQQHRVVDTQIPNFRAFVLYIDNALIQSSAEEMYGSVKLEMNNSCFGFRPELKNIIHTFIHESNVNQPGSELMLEILAVQASVILLREGSHNFSRRMANTKIYSDEKSIKRTLDYISDNYQSAISLHTLASKTNYSLFHFLRIFKLHTGMTPFEYLLTFKIEKAKNFLTNTNYTIAQICDLCGFNSCSYFSQIFKKKTGFTPTDFRKSIMKKYRGNCRF